MLAIREMVVSIPSIKNRYNSWKELNMHYATLAAFVGLVIVGKLELINATAYKKLPQIACAIHPGQTCMPAALPRLRMR